MKKQVAVLALILCPFFRTENRPLHALQQTVKKSLAYVYTSYGIFNPNDTATTQYLPKKIKFLKVFSELNLSTRYLTSEQKAFIIKQTNSRLLQFQRRHSRQFTEYQTVDKLIQQLKEIKSVLK